MNLSFSAQDFRFPQWAAQYEDFLSSGLSQANWCRIHNIKPSTFRYRCRQVRIAASKLNDNKSNTHELLSESIDFAPVTFCPSNTPSKGCIHISLNEKSLDIDDGISTEHLKMILEVVFNA